METQIPFEDTLFATLKDQIFIRRLVLWLKYVKKFNASQIREFTDIPLSSIYYILDKWAKTGQVEDLPREGRPHVLSKIQQNKIVSMQMQDRFKSVKDITRDVNKNIQSIGDKNEITYTQVYRVIQKNFKTVTALYKIQLSVQNKLKRLQFIQNFKEMRKWKIDSIVWTDEKVFQLSPQQKKFKVKILFDEDKSDFTLPMKQMGGGSVMFWGAVSSKGKIFLCVLEGKINSEFFSNFLNQKAIPAIQKIMGYSYILQQDNAPPHKGKTTEFLKNSNITVLEWPPYSPDMNPIEKVWMWMQAKVGNKQFQNKKELVDYVFSLWENLTNEVIQKFIDFLPRKLEWIESNKGDIYEDS